MKQFILDRHTTPGTPVMDQVPTEKIPIYDSQQDAESDLANLEENQIVGTKESKFDVDDMKQYIRNQNVLSDYESITISTDVNNPTVMEYDGFLVMVSATNNELQIYVNGVKIAASVYNSAQGNSSTIAVKQGDTVYYTGGTPSSSKVSYYTLRDYSDR